MPLTLPTHPMAVVPLKLWRPRWFDGLALAIGAIAPDLGYLTYGFIETVPTHNLPALLWWGLPVTLVAVRLVRWGAPVITAHLPDAGPLRLRDYGVLGIVRHPWYVTAVSALLGSFSHLAWDWFTHPGYFPVLRREAWPGTPWWSVFSDASNLVGFAAGSLLVIHIGRNGLLRRWHGQPPPGTALRPVTFWSTVAVVLGSGLTLVVVHPVDWVAGQAIRVLLVACLALLCGAATARIAASSRHRRADPCPGSRPYR